MTEGTLHYDRFTTYGCDTQDGVEMAIVPEEELQDLITFANLAKAAGPANCNHPADALEAFELVPDACICGECGCVLKNYGAREAKALGIAPGWTRLGSRLLLAEILHAFMPITNALDNVSSEVSRYSTGGAMLTFLDNTARGLATLDALIKAGRK